MKKLWDQVINTSLHKGLGTLEIKTVRLTSGITAISILMGLNFYPNVIRFLPDTMILFVLLSAWINLSIPSLLLVRELNFHFYLVTIIAVAYFIYSAKEKVFQFLIIGLVSLIT